MQCDVVLSNPVLFHPPIARAPANPKHSLYRCPVLVRRVSTCPERPHARDRQLLWDSLHIYTYVCICVGSGYSRRGSGWG